MKLNTIIGKKSVIVRIKNLCLIDTNTISNNVCKIL